MLSVYPAGAVDPDIKITPRLESEHAIGSCDARVKSPKFSAFPVVVNVIKSIVYLGKIAYPPI
jgi:hypothetical protein